MDRTRPDVIAAAIEQLIFDGTFCDGDRMDEVQLADRFLVSRTPIREALNRLAHSGLVEHVPRRGVFVRQPGPVELMEMFEVMAELEAICARYAASRMTDAALVDLREANQRCTQAAEANDPDAYYSHNEAFHQLIYAASCNGFLEGEARKLQRRLQPFRRLQLSLRGRMAQSLSEHDAVLDALSRGDAAEAGRALHSHVAIQGEKFHHLKAILSDKRPPRSGTDPQRG
ncbi:GntR family transcriptional regulator [Marinovum sp. 2_MG-2023]|uniref:GntR family transcriptional regulator n=1 Tax=unclassified Marinovum TaxID=2647166 RepID=UPI0026E36AE9|nr:MULTISPECIES: GntR family transcriptional regulator [unclassified Marinovum]MDO6731180.1 GntR family transcriptional regulator [Marinovum sp. 2_MG-2023]MDO6780668.1 GntR family transcriptional regulator [Marinovum sp. 1_MG-2023]